MKEIKGLRKNNERRRYMERVKTKTEDLLDKLLEQSTNDWTELCTTCTTLIKEAKMSNEDIDEIVERVKRENG